MYHLAEGFHFERLDNGSVKMTFTNDLGETGEIICTDHEWASMLTSLSKTGEDSEKFNQALQFHNS